MKDERGGKRDPRDSSGESSFRLHPSSFREGISLFNEHRFWHAHEAWERIWLTASGDEKRFLQGLIQLAAAYHHVQRGTLRGAGRLFDAALTKLAPFAEGHGGVARAAVVERAAADRLRIAEGEQIDIERLPKLRYN